MKPYLITTGILFALMSVSHIFITIDHYGKESSDIWFILAPVIVVIICTALAMWAFSLVRRSKHQSMS